MGHPLLRRILSMSGDPLDCYVRDKGSAVAHHWDYLRLRADHALCGHPFVAPVWEGEDRPRAVCRASQGLLPAHEADWWRRKAEAIQSQPASLRPETDALRERVTELEKHVDNQRSHLRHLNAKLGAGERASFGWQSCLKPFWVVAGGQVQRQEKAKEGEARQHERGRGALPQ